LETAAAGENPPPFNVHDINDQTQEPQGGNTNQHRNFRALATFAPEIISGEATYMRFTAGQSFMPLSIDRLSDNRISMAHHYEQNGDLMADPDMEFVIDRKVGTLSARTYQQDGLRLFQNVEAGTGQIANPNLAKKLDSFARQWFSNIKEQGYQKEKMNLVSLDDEIEIKYDADGKISAINGWTEAVDAYVQKNGIELPSDNQQLIANEQPSLYDIDNGAAEKAKPACDYPRICLDRILFTVVNWSVMCCRLIGGVLCCNCSSNKIFIARHQFISSIFIRTGTCRTVTAFNIIAVFAVLHDSPFWQINRIFAIFVGKVGFSVFVPDADAG
jgi:uncharacterized protein YuzE